ncbi:acetylcholinesterase-like [Dermacentor variabilis]|uniref:acetylcholinesterase-like n=1 Tax=Dermacentor variabilis TaxID=34621 RepID=UPI003F5B684E
MRATMLLVGFMVASLAAISAQEASDEVVQTITGAVRGVDVPTTTGSVRAYLGLPFAEPPVGELRFKKPVPKMPWKGVYNATSQPPLCPQMPVRINNFFLIRASDPVSEDCLYVNVFVPTRNDSSLLPVIVYLPGGGFSYGGISIGAMDTSELAVRGNVITVAVGYRLGAFGFLYMDIEDAPGNMGLYDQLLALKWVRNNIRAFGGDSSRVTLMGESAGSIAVGMQLISPKSKGLFKRAVMQSGSPFTAAVVSDQKQGLFRAYLLSRALGCDGGEAKNSAEDVVKCLKSKPFMDILNATESFNAGGLDSFFPVFGEEMLPEKPAAALKRGIVNADELLAGICESEGDLFLYFLFNKLRDMNSIEDVMSGEMIFLIKALITSTMEVDPDPIIKYYFNGVNVTQGREPVYIGSSLIGDMQFGCPTLGFAKRFLRTDRSVYMYQWSQQASFVDWPEWTRPTHGDDIFFSLGSGLKLAKNATRDDIKATENFIHILSTFSHTGVPKVLDNTSWPKFNDEEQYLDLRREGNVVKKRLLQPACEFWGKVRPYE